MKKKKSLLSRKAKTVIYSLIALLALAAIIQGNFPITPWNAFRLTEKADLVGPSTILGTESVSSLGQDGVIVAKTDKFCMTYAYQHFSFREQDKDKDHILCKKKTGDLTFLSILGRDSYSVYSDENEHLPIILFDDYPEAVRATLVVSPRIVIDDELYQKTYTATANRKADGYFLFRIHWPVQVDINSYMDEHSFIVSYMDQYSLIDFMRKDINSSRYPPVCRAPATICLYDKYGQLILERDLDLTDP